MKRYLYGSAVCAGQSVNYYLLVTPLARDLEEYGIRVEMAQEYIEILSLSLSWRRVEGILSRLMSGSVTPVTAVDVVEDLIA